MGVILVIYSAVQQLVGDGEERISCPCRDSGSWPQPPPDRSVSLADNRGIGNLGRLLAIGQTILIRRSESLNCVKDVGGKRSSIEATHFSFRIVLGLAYPGSLVRFVGMEQRIRTQPGDIRTHIHVFPARLLRW